jgi:hypothetical protein
MRKILLMLGFLTLNFLCLGIYAQPLLSKAPLKTSNSPSFMHAPSSESADDLVTELAIYSLIIGVYALYWLKQRA